MNINHPLAPKKMNEIEVEERMIFSSGSSTFILMAAIILLTFFFSTISLAGSLQITPEGAAPDWDRLNPTQTGYVGVAPVTFTTTRTDWASTFSDENPLYGGSGWGSLATSPDDNTGDFLGIYVDKGDVFTITVTLNGEFTDPVFYFHDLDAVDATLTFPAGFNVAEHNNDGNLSGQVFTVLSGTMEGTSGAFIAVQYPGTYVDSDQFVFEFDYSGVTGLNNELISMGMAMPGDLQPTPPVHLDMAVLDQTDSPITRANGGDTITYHLTATNNSDEDQAGVIVVNTLPPASEMEFVSATYSNSVSATHSPLVDPTTVTWSIGDLLTAAPDNEASLDIEMIVKDGLAAGTDIINSAKVTAPFDGETVSESLGIGGADLEVSFLATDDVSIIDRLFSDGGIRVKLIFTVLNNGPETADNIQLAGFATFDPPIDNGRNKETDFSGPCTSVAYYFYDVVFSRYIALDEFDCTVGTLAPGESKELFYSMDISTSGPDILVTYAGRVGAGKPYDAGDVDADSAEDFIPPDFLLSNNINEGGTTIFRQGGQGGSSCFIATAAYGSYMEPEVLLLRQFRDHQLLTNWPGQQLVKAYYAASPPLADFIARHDSLRFISRILLTPLVYAIKFPLWALAIFLLLSSLMLYRVIRFTKCNELVR